MKNYFHVKQINQLKKYVVILYYCQNNPPHRGNAIFKNKIKTRTSSCLLGYLIINLYVNQERFIATWTCQPPVRSTLHSPSVSFFLSFIFLISNTSSYTRVREPTNSDLTSLLSIENEHVCRFMIVFCQFTKLCTNGIIKVLEISHQR